MSRALLATLFRFALALSLVVLPGCASWQPGQQGPDARQTGDVLRPQGKGASLFGLDPRARQIERNLGL